MYVCMYVCIVSTHEGMGPNTDRIDTYARTQARDTRARAHNKKEGWGTQPLACTHLFTLVPGLNAKVQ